MESRLIIVTDSEDDDDPRSRPVKLPKRTPPSTNVQKVYPSTSKSSVKKSASMPRKKITPKRNVAKNVNGRVPVDTEIQNLMQEQFPFFYKNLMDKVLTYAERDPRLFLHYMHLRGVNCYVY